jgi:hypothetical protein
VLIDSINAIRQRTPIVEIGLVDERYATIEAQANAPAESRGHAAC